MTETMQGKTVVITGGTNGIGLVTARELARMGAQVVIVSRSEDKCAKTVEQIKKDTGNTNVEFIAADLSVMANIRQAAYEFKNRHTRLDVLVNNAGAIFFKRQVTSDGFEMTFALNHLSYFLFTHLLLDTLKASAPSRIVNVASHAHEGARINFDDLMGGKKYSGYGAYGSSKLANIMFTYELAEKLAGTRVTANALHPGFVATGFARNNGGIINFGMGLTHLFARTPQRGAETSIYLASSPEVEDITGKYFTDCKAVESDPVSYDKAAQEKLWEASLEMIVSK
jgi:NAD(P)-dependent dehydrogenase (short-subunit alcohol dehydrogenase family)